MSAANPLGSAPFGTGDQRAYEPSMEEILASIRRIIADDQTLAARGLAADPAPQHQDSQVPEPSQDEALFREEFAAAPAEVAEAEPHDAEQGAVPSQADVHEQPVAEHDSVEQLMAPHGPVAAPQFPMPAQSSEAEAQTAAAAASSFLWEQPEPEPVEQSTASRLFAAATPASDLRPTPSWAPADVPKAAEPSAQLFSAQTMQSVSSAFQVLAASRLADNSEELLDMARDMIRPLLKTWLDDNLPGMVERMVRAEIERVARGR